MSMGACGDLSVNRSKIQCFLQSDARGSGRCARAWGLARAPASAQCPYAIDAKTRLRKELQVCPQLSGPHCRAGTFTERIKRQKILYAFRCRLRESHQRATQKLGREKEKSQQPR